MVFPGPLLTVRTNTHNNGTRASCSKHPNCDPGVVDTDGLLQVEYVGSRTDTPTCPPVHIPSVMVPIGQEIAACRYHLNATTACRTGNFQGRDIGVRPSTEGLPGLLPELFLKLVKRGIWLERNTNLLAPQRQGRCERDESGTCTDCKCLFRLARSEDQRMPWYAGATYG